MWVEDLSVYKVTYKTDLDGQADTLLFCVGDIQGIERAISDAREYLGTAHEHVFIQGVEFVGFVIMGTDDTVIAAH